jgi:beta-1,3-N-acetylglucosaminyltransferase 5
VANQDKRSAIRETWGNLAAYDTVRLGFVVGKTTDSHLSAAVHKENVLHGDLIQTVTVDHWANLTLKHAAMLDFVQTYCNSVPLVMKTDDDIYVQIPRLFTTLEPIKGTNNAIYGTVFKNHKVYRSVSSKYCVPRELYSHSHFPDFCVGEAYIMTRDVIPKLFRGLMKKTNTGSEDAVVTGVVAEELGIQRVHLPDNILHLPHSRRGLLNNHQLARWLLCRSTCIIDVKTTELFHMLWRMEREKENK